MALDKWTKRLDDMHLYQPGYQQGPYKTLCGKVMLGNNYAKEHPERKMCEACKQEALNELDMGQTRMKIFMLLDALERNVKEIKESKVYQKKTPATDFYMDAGRKIAFEHAAEMLKTVFSEEILLGAK